MSHKKLLCTRSHGYLSINILLRSKRSFIKLLYKKSDYYTLRAQGGPPGFICPTYRSIRKLFTREKLKIDERLKSDPWVITVVFSFLSQLTDRPIRSPK